MDFAIAVPDLDGYTPRDPEWDSCGWDMARCSISFYRWSLRLAAEVGFFPDSLTQIFEKLISEEARHITFFSNDLTLRKFIETCVEENERRMQVFDPRLPRQPCCRNDAADTARHPEPGSDSPPRALTVG
jgi:hypothetical protein